MVANPQFIDVGAASGLPPVDIGRLQATISAALAHSGVSVGPQAWRSDSDRSLDTSGVVDRWRVDYERMQFQQRADAMQVRRDDAFSGQGVGAFSRQLEHVRQKIWTEKRQPLTALKYFPIDSGVPLGATKHTARRYIAEGRAEFHTPGSQVPMASGSYVEETFNTAIIVCGVNQNVFEGHSINYAGLRTYEFDLRHAHRLVDEKLNRTAWFGDRASGLYGLANYPSLARQVMTVPFTDATDPQVILKALYDLGNTPYIISGERFAPTNVVVGTRIKTYLYGRKHDPNGGPDSTIAKFYLENNPLGISEIESAPELDGIGPNGESAIYFYRPDLDVLGHCLIQPTTVMPLFQSSPFDTMTVVFAVDGGGVGGDIGHNIVGLAETNIP